MQTMYFVKQERDKQHKRHLCSNNVQVIRSHIPQRTRRASHTSTSLDPTAQHIVSPVQHATVSSRSASSLLPVHCYAEVHCRILQTQTVTQHISTSHQCINSFLLHTLRSKNKTVISEANKKPNVALVVVNLLLRSSFFIKRVMQTQRIALWR